MNHNMDKHIKKAYEEALTARQSALAPYSRFKVGACFRCSRTGSYFSGFNIENASYPAGMCAERVALYSMASQLKAPPSPEFLVIVTDTEYALGPCGQCLQVMTEFAPPPCPSMPPICRVSATRPPLGDLIRFDAQDFQNTLRKKG